MPNRRRNKLVAQMLKWDKLATQAFCLVETPVSTRIEEELAHPGRDTTRSCCKGLQPPFTQMSYRRAFADAADYKLAIEETEQPLEISVLGRIGSHYCVLDSDANPIINQTSHG